MSEQHPPTPAGFGQAINRRQFLAGTGATALSFTLASHAQVSGTQANSRINLALFGCGKRGTWITNLFLRDGRYNVAAVFDYFADKAEEAGAKFNVGPSNRYSGLWGYRKLLEQKGIDAVVIESPPYFHPQQAADAVAAGKHVYVAKPIAVDVPGCQTIAQSGQQATARKLVFLVDFQTRANPAYQEVVKRCREGQIGRLVSMEATYHCGPTWARLLEQLKGRENDPENRLRAWGIDRILSGDVITEQNIHCLDVATWFADAHPLAAYGTGGLARGFGTCWDHFAVIYYFPNDVLVSFNSKQMGHGYDDILCRVYGTEGTIDTHYSGKITMKAKEDGFNGDSNNLYQAGVVSNIATFYTNITQQDFTNVTVAPSVRSNLTTILGRTAAYQKREVTWDQMLKANEKWEFDLKTLRG